LSLLNWLSSSATGAVSTSESLDAFLRMYFIAHYIMTRTAYEDGFDEEFHGWLQDDAVDEIDVLMGCSRGLMDLIQRISNLATRAKNVSDVMASILMQYPIKSMRNY
jgi:hypothetical protein